MPLDRRRLWDLLDLLTRVRPLLGERRPAGRQQHRDN
jgi:hypothetical protein